MFVIGLTGCAGSGKSYVAKCIEEAFDIPVIDSDTECRMLQKPGTEVFSQIVRAFGEKYVTPDGALDRGKLAGLVFSDPAALAKLNSLTHPATILRIRELIGEYDAQGKRAVIVESALAEQAGYRQFCDVLWLVYAPLEDRIERMREIRGYSEEKIASVIASQMRQEDMMAACERVIYNGNGVSRLEILHQARFFLGDLPGFFNCGD